MQIGQIIKERYEITQLWVKVVCRMFIKLLINNSKEQLQSKHSSQTMLSKKKFVERFKREAQTAANLNHPNIVQIFDWGIEKEPYFVMEYIEGNTLTSIIAKNRTISLSDILFIGAQVSNGLHAAHQKRACA